MSKANDFVGKSETETQAFLNQKKPTVSAGMVIPTQAGMSMIYQSMVLQKREGVESNGRYPLQGYSEQEWEECGMGHYLAGSGCSRGSIVHPLYCEVLTEVEYEGLPEVSKLRCVPQPAEEGSGFYHCPRSHIDGEYEGAPCLGVYVANGVRFAKPGEISNCCIMLDWDWGKLPEDEKDVHRRCILCSTQKTERGFEWRIDRRRAMYLLGIGLESSSSDSESEDECGASSSKGKVLPARVGSKRLRSGAPAAGSSSSSKADVSDDGPEMRQRLVGATESTNMHLGDMKNELVATRSDLTTLATELVHMRKILLTTLTFQVHRVLPLLESMAGMKAPAPVGPEVAEATLARVAAELTEDPETKDSENSDSDL